MSYGVLYRSEWMMRGGSPNVIMKIWDTRVPDIGGDPIQHNPRPSGSPLMIEVVNSQLDKFDPVILGKRAVFEFISEHGLDFTTFCEAPDNAFLMEVTTDLGDNLFTGFLSLADMKQDWLPNPNVVRLTATDHLSMLRDVPLTDDDGNRLQGKYKISELIALCLKKTGLELPIRVVNNLRHGSGDATYIATFSVLGNYMVVQTLQEYWYPGQVVTISGTASNNGTFHVDHVISSIVQEVHFVETITVGEVQVSTDFVDESSNGHFYDEIFIDVATFEKEIGELEDCNTVLIKLLGEDCRLQQVNWEWWITRTDEYDDSSTGGLYVASFDADGVFQSLAAEAVYDKTIGRAEVLRVALADQLMMADRPLGTCIEVFDYLYPKEIPPNVDFSRGDLFQTISDYEKHYNIDDWTLLRGYGASETTPNIEAYIQRNFNSDGYETERYVVLTMPPAFAAPTNFIRSSPVYISEKDKFDYSFDWRFPNDDSGGGFNTYNLGAIRLVGDNGTYWFLDDDGKWYETTSAWVFQQKIFQETWDPDDLDESEWRTKSIEAEPAPATGFIWIELWAQRNINDAHYETDIHFSNVDFTYKPYINGTYQKYTGQHQKITRDPEDWLAKRETTVYVGDSPKKLLKGSMFFINRFSEIYSGSVQFTAPNILTITGYHLGVFRAAMYVEIVGTLNNLITRVLSVSYTPVGDFTTIVVEGTVVNESVSTTISEAVFVLTDRFWPFNVFPGGIGGDMQFAHPYGELQIRSVFNQYRNSNRIIEGHVKELYTTGGTPFPQADLIWKYSFTANEPNVRRKYFLLVGMNQNWKTGMWKGWWIECYNRDFGKVYTDTREFKYITE